MVPSPSRKTDKCADLLDRLQAVSAVARVSADEIIEGLFPEQASYLVASRLLELAVNDARLVASRNPLHDADKPLLSPPRSRRKKRRANQRSVPLQPLRALPSALNCESGLSHAELALVLWDAKMERQQLSREDGLFLLLREDTVRALESARLLRLSRVSYEQAMELELTLESMRSDHTVGGALPSRVEPRARRQPPLSSVLIRNAWMQRKAFAVRQSSVSIEQALLPSQAIQQTGMHPSKRIATALCPPSNCDAENRMHCADSLSRFSPIRKPQRIVMNPAIVKKTASYLRTYCVDELVHRPGISSPSPTPSFWLLRKRFAVEKLAIVINRHHQKAKARRIRRWHDQAHWSRCQERVEAFCKLKCALWIMRRARWQLRRLVLRSWERWLSRINEQKDLEQSAALVTIQSWRRQVIGRRKAGAHAVQQAAIAIQARWRGFYARKMLVRRHRYVRFSLAATKIQRCYRSHRFHQRFTRYMQEMRSARVLTRSVRAYGKKRRDFRAWSHRLARYHAAVAIQIWGRRQRARIQWKRTRCQQLDAAARVLARFFRWARFMLRFGSRVQRLVQERIHAAVKLQTAYRAKRARARFNELMDRLEEQRRLEILRVMWENAYASTIQTWWRRSRLRAKAREVAGDLTPSSSMAT